MEDGQKIDINLESPLDTKSSDMLVSVQDTRFAHNRQKFQGHVLPTSLRYERNGWAAGWYVYDFKMGGGYIFSKNETPVIEGGEWLAANRSKVNNTPTYVISFYTARNDNDEDTPDNRTELKQYADAVRDIQFQAWFTDTASVNARECEEADITTSAIPELSFNYAVEDHDYRNVIRFTPYKNLTSEGLPAGVEFDTGNCFETLSPDMSRSADLTMEFVDRADDGTVTAILNNNEVRWVWGDDVYIPKDLIDDEGNKFAKFEDVTNEVITWKLGNQVLQYDDAQNKFIYDEITHDPNTNLIINFNIPVTYTIPLTKYYSALNNISWSIQGTRTLISSEDSDNPVNSYRLSMPSGGNSIAVHNGNLATVGIDGPDVSIVSQAEISLAGLVLSDSDTSNILFNGQAENAIQQSNIGKLDVPIASIQTKSFKMPNEDVSRDVTIQLYLACNNRSEVGLMEGRRVYVSAYGYRWANMATTSAVKEVLYVDQVTSNLSYKLDNRSIAASESASIDITNSNYSGGKSHIAVRNIIGWKADFKFKLKGVNGTVYSDQNNTLDINTTIVCNNLAFTYSIRDQDWEQFTEAAHSFVNADRSYSRTISDGNGTINIQFRLNNSQNWEVSDGSNTYDVYFKYDRGNSISFFVSPYTCCYKLTLLSVFNRNGASYGMFKATEEYDESGQSMHGSTADLGYCLIKLDSVSSMSRGTTYDNRQYVMIFGDFSYTVTAYGETTTYTYTCKYARFDLSSSDTTKYISAVSINSVPLKNSDETRDIENAFIFNGAILAFKETSGSLYVEGVANLRSIPQRLSARSLTYPYDLPNAGLGAYADFYPNIGVDNTNHTIKVFTSSTSGYILNYDLDRNYYIGSSHVLDDLNLSLNMINSVSFDVIDNKTGELLIDHKTSEVQLSGDSELKFTFKRSNLCKGKLFFNNTVPANLVGNSNPSSQVRANIYKGGAASNALFPVSVYTDYAGSIYSDYSGGCCQGVAVYNFDGKYAISILSNVRSYILPPKVSEDVLYIYAAKTYTHHVKLTDYTVVFNNKFLTDNSTNISALEVTPRSSVYDVPCETNNKYYVEDTTFITPAAIAYYNNQIHITYKPKSGNSVIIDGNTYDASTSDMSVKQEADLASVYLPKYSDSDTKYNFVLGNHDDVLTTKETKEIINTIADTKKHWVSVALTSINFSAADPVVTLQFKEYHDNDNNEANNNSLSPAKTRSVSYNSSLTHSEAFINTEYSDDSQIVADSTVDGTATIGLPAMPVSGKFKYNVAGGIVELVDSADTTSHFKYDYNSNKVTEMYIKGKELAKASAKLNGADVSHIAYNVYSISVNQNINTLVYFKHYGIYKFAALTTGAITPLIKELQYNPQNKHEISVRVSDLVYIGNAEPTPVGTNTQYTLDFSHFEDKEECTPKFLDYSATDVRDDNPDTQTKQFARVMADNEYQLVKQHWDSTVATECFWWVDESHTLELTKDRFILKAKVIDGSYDDWMGDKWETVYELPRTDFLTSEADTFICSSANGRNARSYLYILQPNTVNSIKVTIYDPLDNMSAIIVKIITFKHVELGTKKKATPLNIDNDCASDNYIVGTYSDIVSSSLLADSKLSAVCIDGIHWLGIQYDRNFNQWAFAFGSMQKIIQGYGCVGINKYATGGMIPAKYFDGTGFNDTVYNINELEAETDRTLKTLDEFNIFNERVVGDENQQWYISEELSDIVMAVDLVKGSLIKLPITNKYAQVYSSPSYVKYTVHALGIQIKQLMNLFTDEDNPIWKEIMTYAMFPLVWYLSPYTNIINYLQQTLGQYAYVHYNSTSIGKQSSKLHDEADTDNAGLSENETANHIDALITDDLSFDVLHIPQEQSFKDNAWDNVLGIFASMVVSATDYAMKDLTVNSLQNQSAVSDIGKKFSQSFLQNIGSMSVTGFNMQSTKPMLKSEVTAVKTLDMFYSTSAQQNCFAGPGFVNMQFVAQCTAQSVTSVQLEAQQTQIFMLLRQLTTWQGKATIFVLDLLKDFMFKMSDNMAGGPSAGVVVGLGWIGALVTSALGYALVAAKALVKLGIETVDSMLDSFFPGGIKTNVTAQLSRHNYDIEGKHAYGNKSESFMWPCADCTSKLYTDESVDAVLQDKSWPLEMPKATTGNMQFKPVYSDQPKCFTITPDIMNSQEWDGKVPYSIAMCKGSQKRRALPDSTAYVIGTESFMPTVPFKNENIGEGEPVFTPPPVQDYLIDKNWNIFVTAMAGDALWVSCKDTKLFDGNYSNIVVTDSFCGIAAPHVVVEVKRNICEEYLRPWAVSPDAIALNITGLNCAYEEVAYHAFDGYGYRITDWLGSSGMNKEHYTLQYCFQINDRFKRSNKLPPNQFMGNFQAVPSMSLDIKDKVFNDIQVTTEEKGMRTGVAGENKDTQRYSLPIFTEQISSLPAIVRALSPYKLAVIDGITSLTTDIRISQSVYKIPDSVDFNINDKLYRMTNEYICSVDHEKGLEVVKYLVPALGLTYLGATPFMAYFYNQATRQYYIYQGGNTLQVMDMLERFRDIKSGIYDFINQEVVMPCLATMTRLDRKVKDDADETDNIVIPVFRHNRVGGELTPPITTVFNTDSWYRTVSTPAGLVFQGPNRCIINRFIWSQYMLKDIKANKGKWKKVPREEYHPFRGYSQKYETMPRRVATDAVKGWTHNPFLLVTSPLGVNEETDCKFEWEITFAWTTEMEQLYEYDEYVTVNVMAETMAPGGKVFSRPTHIFLHKELFTRTNNYGYYSFRYQSNNGAGNRERLHIWSDGYIAVSSLQLEYKVISSKRSEQLVTQEDIKGMKEM